MVKSLIAYLVLCTAVNAAIVDSDWGPSEGENYSTLVISGGRMEVIVPKTISLVDDLERRRYLHPITLNSSWSAEVHVHISELQLVYDEEIIIGVELGTPSKPMANLNLQLNSLPSDRNRQVVSSLVLGENFSGGRSISTTVVDAVLRLSYSAGFVRSLYKPLDSQYVQIQAAYVEGWNVTEPMQLSLFSMTKGVLESGQAYFSDFVLAPEPATGLWLLAIVAGARRITAARPRNQLPDRTGCSVHRPCDELSDQSKKQALRHFLADSPT